MMKENYKIKQFGNTLILLGRIHILCKDDL